MRHSLKLGLLVAALAATASTPSYAWHGGGHWGGRGWGWGGFFAGAAITGLAFESAYLASYPYAYSPYYAYPAPVYVQPAYVQPAYVQAAPAAASYAPQVAAAGPPVWYYCGSSKGYYPYVQNCKEGWRSVPTTPPGL